MATEAKRYTGTIVHDLPLFFLIRCAEFGDTIRLDKCDTREELNEGQPIEFEMNLDWHNRRAVNIKTLPAPIEAEAEQPAAEPETLARPVTLDKTVIERTWFTSSMSQDGVSMNITEAAKRLNLSKSMVQRHIEGGRLAASVVTSSGLRNRYEISEEAIDAFNREHPVQLNGRRAGSHLKGVKA